MVVLWFSHCDAQGEEVGFHLLAIFCAYFCELVVGYHLDLCDGMCPGDTEHKVPLNDCLSVCLHSWHALAVCVVFFFGGGGSECPIYLVFACVKGVFFASRPKIGVQIKGAFCVRRPASPFARAKS